MTKRETCEWAEPVASSHPDAGIVVSRCTWPTPPWVPLRDSVVFDYDCDRCPCWKQKGGPTVEAQCTFCGETKPFSAALVPIQPKPRVCAECAEKETTDAE